jgi:putative phosphoribosyl transferase
MIFKDRSEAGQKLAEKLKIYQDKKDTIILALPRGGVVVAYQIAQRLNLPLDLVVPRKIGAPDNEEYAIGAITETGEGIFNEEIIKALGISQAYLKQKVAAEKKEAQRRLLTYRQGNKPLDLKNKTVILVDDGIATGLTMQAAIKSLKKQKIKKIIVASPITAIDSLQTIQKNVDQVIYLDAPPDFAAVGQFYQIFDQTTDQQVIDLMQKSRH